MKNEIALRTSDLQEAGISAQLTSNDLIEVIASEIFDKVLSEVKQCDNATEQITEASIDIMKPEIDEFRLQLIKENFVNEHEDGWFSFSKVNGDDWSSTITIMCLKTTDKERGLKIEKEYGKRFNYPRGQKAHVMLTAKYSETNKDEEKRAGGISGTISTSITKEFKKTIVVSTGRFKKMFDAIKDHNKRIDKVDSIIPKTGLLSVERFTREARVKMNKKILSSQPQEFKNKMAQIFNIQL